MVTCDSSHEANLSRVTLRPNCSLSWHQSMMFLGAIAVPLLLVSLVLAAKGYWMILPFAGVELAALFVSLYVVAHAACRSQVISIGESFVTVEKGRDRGNGPESLGPEHCAKFARAWVRIELAQDARHWYPRRLWIGASGKRVEIGEFLVEEEKAELAAELRKTLSA